MTQRDSTLALAVTLLLVASAHAQGWAPHRPAQSPPARLGSELAYDSVRDRVVMFGGWTGSTNLGDTWEFDGTSWRQVATSGSPSPRHAHMLEFDPISSRTLLFGGIASTALNDTWSWDGATWTQHPSLPISPSPRFQMGAAFFPPRGRILTYGGQIGSFTFHADM